MRKKTTVPKAPKAPKKPKVKVVKEAEEVPKRSLTPPSSPPMEGFYWALSRSGKWIQKGSRNKWEPVDSYNKRLEDEFWTQMHELIEYYESGVIPGTGKLPEEEWEENKEIVEPQEETVFQPASPEIDILDVDFLDEHI